MTRQLDLEPDETLLAAVAAGDREAFATLFRRRQRDVYRFALHMTAAPAIAEDVTQDAFLIVMREAGRFEPGRSTPAAWLCGIARNCARQRLERDRTLQPLSHDEADDERLAVHPDPLGDLTRADRIEMLRKAVVSLPLRYREVVVLCDLQELSYAEAADAIGCAIGTVRSRLHRGRAMLASKLSERRQLHLPVRCFA
jgi:RNA polymerase sigma-70 factor (ECF subfamily)